MPTASAEPLKDYVVMFVDMYGSTQLKYTYDRDEDKDFPQRLILRVYQLILDHVGGHYTKFTGDGGMTVFHMGIDGQGARDALAAAEQIIQAVDRKNLKFTWGEERIRIRIGIASGP